MWVSCMSIWATGSRTLFWRLILLGVQETFLIRQRGQGLLFSVLAMKGRGERGSSVALRDGFCPAGGAVITVFIVGSECWLVRSSQLGAEGSLETISVGSTAGSWRRE